MDLDVLRRLAFIRYLFKRGVEISKAPSPMSSESTLKFHDAAELFLHLVAVELGVNTKGKIGFMAYWQRIEDKHPQGMAPTRKEDMRKLNDARRELKHRGEFPHELRIESARISASNFFEENTPKFFGLDFDDVSLTVFVDCEQGREKLEKAESLLGNGQFDDALDEIALAFEVIVKDYEDRKRDQFRRSPFFFGDEHKKGGTSFLLEDPRRSGLSDRAPADPHMYRQLKTHLDNQAQSIREIKQGLKMLALGIDYRRYSRFRLISPMVVQTVGTSGPELNVQRGSQLPKGEFDLDDVQFCFDFVIESAIKMQDFDYSAD